MVKPEDDRSATERLCAVTRQVRPVSELVRFVRAPDGSIAPDLKRKLPGRGVWVTAHRSDVAEAVKRRAFSRSLKQEVAVDPALADRVDALYLKAALDLLSLANKAGKVVTGFSKVEALISGGDPVAVLHASDAAPDGVRKIEQILRRAGLESRVRRLAPFDGPQMDLALGRSNVIHAALIADAVSKAFLARADDLARYRENFAAGLSDAAENGMDGPQETDGE
ncbi:DNA-binding protein [Agaricicola taiwanensis]|uniref:DNA-binding protein n=1 Tax=Agaricicola taiwanensis TaxID=591372 RepID=A0A8J2VKD9_9RHOB|nr:RNA-binding protein [Agaricicola taiwanensis]GGE29288.1 DNA-binding protein [Agaricicola taiwanensis]